MELYQSSLLSTQLSPNQFELSYWQDNPQSLLLAGGRGASQKIMLEGEPFVLRRYLRGGLMAKISYEHYLWLGKGQTRPYKELEVLKYAKQMQLPVPACLAYCVEKKGLFYRAAIMTEFLSNEGTLASYLNKFELNKKHWRSLAKVIKKMHDAQINHADLNADNILVHDLKEGALGFSLIDFDKAKIEKDSITWPLNNINRLQRSLVKLKPKYFNEMYWEQFLETYSEVS